MYSKTLRNGGGSYSGPYEGLLRCSVAASVFEVLYHCFMFAFCLLLLKACVHHRPKEFIVRMGASSHKLSYSLPTSTLQGTVTAPVCSLAAGM